MARIDEGGRRGRPVEASGASKSGPNIANEISLFINCEQSLLGMGRKLVSQSRPHKVPVLKEPAFELTFSVLLIPGDVLLMGLQFKGQFLVGQRTALEGMCHRKGRPQVSLINDLGSELRLTRQAVLANSKAIQSHMT